MIVMSNKKYSKKVDFHAHFLPPAYYEFLEKYEYPKPDAFPTPKWSLNSHLKEMQRLGVAFSLISISSPDLAEAPDAKTAAEYARRINEEGTEYVRENPNKLGLMAELPLPHVEEAIVEAEYAVNELGAYGFGLKTNYKTVYLGSPELDPLMEVLNKYGAIVVIHPTRPSRLPMNVNHDVPIPAMEFFFETTRVFSNMEANNIFRRYPDIKWVFPHAGAFISILDDRYSNFSMFTKKAYKDAPFTVYNDMRHVYFDMAGFPLLKQFQILRKDVPMTHMLYGSDCPYTPEAVCMATAGQLESTSQMNSKQKNMVFTDNAVELIPELEGILKKSKSGGIKVSEYKNIRRLCGDVFDVYDKIKRRRF